MIFGKTTIQRKLEASNEACKLIHGVRKFAILPVKLDDGSYVFLQHYWRFYIGCLRDGLYRILKSEYGVVCSTAHIDFSYDYVCLIDNDKERAQNVSKTKSSEEVFSL